MSGRTASLEGTAPAICRQGVSRLTRDEVRDLTSVIVLIDARSLKGVTFGQVAAYVAMIGLAEVRLDANMGDAPLDLAAVQGISSYTRTRLEPLGSSLP